MEAVRLVPWRVSAQIEGVHPASAARAASQRKCSVELERRLCQSLGMDKSSVIETLRRHEPELRAAGILHLRLFGSVARGEELAQSDVDLMADLDRSRRLSLVGMTHLENLLSDLLDVKVDLSPADSMKEAVRARAVREAIHAF